MQKELTEESTNQINSIFNLHKEKTSALGLEKYDQIILDEDEESLDGRHPKNFYRMDYQSIAQDFEARNNSRFITHFDNISSDDIMLEKISVLKKKATKPAIIRECLSTNVLNFYGVNTPYNFYSHYTGKKHIQHHLLMSIDFVSENQIFRSFCDLSNFNFRDLPTLCKKLVTFYKKHEVFKNPKYKKQIPTVMQQIMLSAMTRMIVLRDDDFCNLNYGLLINPKQKTMKVINFDFEDSFTHSKINDEKTDKDNLIFVKKNFPELYDYFIHISLHIFYFIVSLRKGGEQYDRERSRYGAEVRKRVRDVLLLRRRGLHEKPPPR